ncbi:MAG: hypothetical protein ACREI8_14195, partial [Myxococcota bacterium]
AGLRGAGTSRVAGRGHSPWVRTSDSTDISADEPARARPTPAAHLMPDDFDRALRRMKAELAITELHRRLLDPSLDARAILDITDRIETLQAQR